MRFLLDMPISIETAHFLRNLGHDVVHLRDEDLQKLPDSQIVAKAVEEQRTIISMDLDFGMLLAKAESKLPSVVLFRLEDERPKHVNALLEQSLQEFADDLDKGAIIVIEKDRTRIRRLPI